MSSSFKDLFMPFRNFIVRWNAAIHVADNVHPRWGKQPCPVVVSTQQQRAFVIEQWVNRHRLHCGEQALAKKSPTRRCVVLPKRLHRRGPSAPALQSLALLGSIVIAGVVSQAALRPKAGLPGAAGNSATAQELPQVIVDRQRPLLGRSA